VPVHARGFAVRAAGVLETAPALWYKFHSAHAMTRLLVVDDDDASRRLVAAIFRADNMEVVAASDGASGLARVEELDPDVVLLDVRLPDIDGLEVLRRLRPAERGLSVIMLTAHNDVKLAVRAIQLGAFDYHTKPVDQDEIELAVKRALETRALRTEVADLRRQLGSGGTLAVQMGASVAVKRVIEQVATVAATSFSVLILGETGAGKELVAQAIHRQSPRRAQPFIALDCGAIPEALVESELFGHEKGAFTGADRRKRGQFELAAGGTVFLDEIGNMPLALQSKLLRALEARHVQRVGGGALPIDVRFIAATNDDLQARVAAGQFRADLFFRLAQYTVTLPPLRERRDDIGQLARRFLEEVCVELRRPVIAIAPDALALLERHDWPGNVRELRNVVRQAVLESSGAMLAKTAVQRFVGKVAARTRGPSAPVAGRSLKEAADAAAREAERDVICETLRRTAGNKAEAARLLRTDYKTLHVKMKSLGVRARDFMA
jgi:DNA-binding NtrC family response regulator